MYAVWKPRGESSAAVLASSTAPDLSPSASLAPARLEYSMWTPLGGLCSMPSVNSCTALCRSPPLASAFPASRFSVACDSSAICVP